jgi:hypothetical protein
MVAAPIYRLMKKNVVWSWTYGCQEAMDALKNALISPPALISIDYGPEGGLIILAVDASLQGWGAVLMQLDLQKRRHPCRYESGHWNDAERSYDATKRECRGILKALRKLRMWLYGISFVLETDANTLVAQLNGAASDLPGSLLMRWIAYIRMFDFTVKHVPGTKHTAADGLSRRPRTSQEAEEEELEQDIEEFVDAKLLSIRISPITVQPDELSPRAWAKQDDISGILDDEYSVRFQRIAYWLVKLIRPAWMDKKEYRKFKTDALNFQVRTGQLYRRGSKNVPPRRVIDNEAEKARILMNLHNETGHKGREATYRLIADRYWWEDLWNHVREHVRSCIDCQKRDGSREQEELYSTWVPEMWTKVALDVINMPERQGMSKLVVARCDLSGYVEARAMRNATARNVAKFVYEDVICNHGVFRKLVTDGGPENKELLQELSKTYGIKQVLISAYNSKANGMIEKGHYQIENALAKTCADSGIDNWVFHLRSVLWSDRITARTSTGYSPFYLDRGREPCLPIELEVPTWRILPWDTVQTTEDLVALRARQFERRDKDLEEAKLAVQRHRENGKEVWDNNHRTRAEGALEVGQLVLLHNTKLDKDMSSKLDYRWIGPYRILEAIAEKGTYILAELDGTRRAGTVAGNRLKRLILSRKTTDHTYVQESTLTSVLTRVFRPVRSREDNHGTIIDGGGEEDLSSEEEQPQMMTREAHGVRAQEKRKEEDRAHIPAGQRYAVVLGGKKK